jgi:hypothetical protein
MYCEKCGCKLAHKGRPLSRSYVHIYKDKYGIWCRSKIYNNCNEPIPQNRRW